MLRSALPVRTGQKIAVLEGLAPFFSAKRQNSSSAEASASISTPTSDSLQRPSPGGFQEANPIQPLTPGRSLRFALRNPGLFVDERDQPVTVSSASKRTPWSHKKPTAPQSSNSAASSSTVTEPPVFLKPNPYTDIYEVDEAELDDDLESHLSLVSPEDSTETENDTGDGRIPTNFQLRFSEHRSLYVRPDHFIYENTSARGTQQKSIISFARLRDACLCPLCVHPSTRQKRATTSQMVRNLADGPFSIRGSKKIEGGGYVTRVRVKWKHHVEHVEGGLEEHVSYYSPKLISHLGSGGHATQVLSTGRMKRQKWTRAGLLSTSNLKTEFAVLAQPDSLLESQPMEQLLEQLHRYGFAMIEGVPTDRTDDKSCSLRTVAEMIGPIRNTFYGETWDVKSVVNSKNIAYTSDNLGLHMDLL